MSNPDSEDPRKGFDGSQGPENTDSPGGQDNPDAMSDEEVRDILKGFEGEFGDSDMPAAVPSAQDTGPGSEPAGSDTPGLSDDELSEFSDQPCVHSQIFQHSALIRRTGHALFCASLTAAALKMLYGG